MGNPFEDLRQAVVVRPMNSPGPQGAAAPEMKIQYSNDGLSWHNDPVDTDRYLRFSTDNGVSWSGAIYFNNLAETLEWVEKARQWAVNPENVAVEDDQYSALHHALRAARSESNAEAAALDAAESAAEAFGAAAPAWDSDIIYNYNDVVSFDNGHTYRCIGTNIVGEDHAPNINGVDNVEEWTRITVAPDGYFEVDENGDFMPMLVPITSEIFMLDENGDIMPQDQIDLELGGAIELYSNLEFVDSINDFRTTSFRGTTEYVYVTGYYGSGTPGGGLFYKDLESSEADNGGTIIIDDSGIRWKRANVYKEYYASWFGVSVDIDDNSPLIQNALNAMPSGSVLIFDPGKYRCKQTITIPDHPDRHEYVKNITIKSSTNFRAGWLSDNTELQYVGPDKEMLTPFIDFRGSSRDKRYIGLIQGIAFSGIGNWSNIVGLWLGFCVETRFENISVSDFKYGIQIDSHYYHCQFNSVYFCSCDYGFRSLSLSNGAVFRSCSFIWCNVCAAHGLDVTSDQDKSIYFNNCYFQESGTAIRPSMGRLLHINQCYFEAISKYIIDIFSVTSSSTIDPMVILENSSIDINPSDLTSNKAVIRQTLSSNRILTLVIRNNDISNRLIIPDYFIYVAAGDIIIEAKNNKMRYIEDNFPICSKTPLKTSYFNNDFSE
jgi:hypothetical protein